MIIDIDPSSSGKFQNLHYRPKAVCFPLQGAQNLSNNHDFHVRASNFKHPTAYIGTGPKYTSVHANKDDNSEPEGKHRYGTSEADFFSVKRHVYLYENAHLLCLSSFR